ncbi:DivIVA domain-containing protein [Allorhizocola rhizosphaerae]|uniref:DivIVA domain-containing protein n=1 Tax=Allorhizocola rhizosphaerae TaxID=1872709 RepID=UPI000E3DFFB5|nr:DivIVA domain-containing protein [Allorhizocola rhizosphaerae]
MNLLLLLVIAVTVGAVVFGVMTLVTGGDPGLKPVDPDSRARPLPGDRPLVESDVSRVTFDVAPRGYRMGQVDQTLRRVAYDIGYKTELIQVLEAEIVALREGRIEDADVLASARAAALRGPAGPGPILDESLTEVLAEESDHDTDRDMVVRIEDLEDTDDEPDGDAAPAEGEQLDKTAVKKVS